MKTIYDVQEYLSGAEFDSNLKMKVTGCFQPSRSRVDSLVNLSQGKRVVHLGCCDHLELIPSKIESGVGSSRVDLQACKLEYSIVSPK